MQEEPGAQQFLQSLQRLQKVSFLLQKERVSLCKCADSNIYND